MPRPKGTEMIAFRVVVTVPTFERLTGEGKGKPVGTYVAEREEQATLVDAKRRGLLQRDHVEPNFKGGKK